MSRSFRSVMFIFLGMLAVGNAMAQEAEPSPSIFAEGVPDNTAAQPAPAAAPGMVSAEAKEQYLTRFVWFQDWVAINAQTGGYMGSWSVPYKGKYQEPLKGSHFYDYVGRPDLASKYRKKTAIKFGILGGSVVLLITGTVVMLTAISADEDCWDLDSGSQEYDSCMDDADATKTRKMVIGGTLAGIGLIGEIVALLIKSHPVSPSEARALADDFNRKLRIELGIPLDMEVSAAQRSRYNTSGVSLQLTSSLGRSNGLGFNLNF